jgi:PKD repeat protein
LVTFAAVHHEDFFHNIDMDWEQAEADVASALCDQDCGQTGPLGEQIAIQIDEGDAGTWRTNGNGTIHWLNDGSATVIPAPEPPDEPPAVTIFLPAVGSTVSSVTPVEIQAGDDVDPAGTLEVEWRIEGGGWQPTTYNPTSGYYEASWDPAATADGDHLFYAQATDSGLNTAGTSHTVTVDNPNEPPSASFSFSCSGLSCDFDASASFDPDGTVAGYDWEFGDLNSGSGETTSHTYAAAGTYNVTLTVTDNEGGTGTDNQNVAVADNPATTAHVGDLQGVSVNVKRNWRADVTILVHDGSEGSVSGAMVSGVWSGDAPGAGCTTDDSGACTVSSAEMSKKTTQQAIFTVTDIEHTLSYEAADNHDPQGDSSGTAIQVNRDGTSQDPGQPPVASFSYDCPDLTCTFDAAGSYDPDGGNIVSYAWDFGGGASANGLTASHTFAAGSHQVKLTVTDDEGSTADDVQAVSVGQADGLTLTAAGYKVKGVHHVDLTWSGATSSPVDIFRDGGLLATVDSGSVPYTDNTGQKGGGSCLYQVCEEGSALCSEVVTVTF